MENLILGLLLLRPLTIYEINKTFKESLSLIYAASYGSIQTAIKKLIVAEKISFTEGIENGRNKKTYSINPSGIEAFYSWMYEPVTEKKLETTMLSKIFFLGLIEKQDDKKALVKQMIEVAETVTSEMISYEKELNQMDLPPEYKTTALYQFKTLNYGVHSHKAALEWLRAFYEEI